MKKYLLLPVLICIIFSGCQKGSSKLAYAKEKYLETEREKKLTPPFLQNEPTGTERLIQVQHKKHIEWERENYETLQEWHLRLISYLEKNDQIIREKKEKLEEAESDTAASTQLIQDLIAQNSLLNEDITSIHIEQDTDFEPLIALPPAPFKIHLVREKETLYSITMHYYNDEDKMLDIMRWNRAWIRHPEELIAGVGLILYPNHVTRTSPQLITDYLQRVLELGEREE